MDTLRVDFIKLFTFAEIFVDVSLRAISQFVFQDGRDEKGCPLSTIFYHTIGHENCHGRRPLYFSQSTSSILLFYSWSKSTTVFFYWSSLTILLFSIWLTSTILFFSISIDARWHCRRPFYNPFHHALQDLALGPDADLKGRLPDILLKFAILEENNYIYTFFNVVKMDLQQN